jgi:Cu(I)/Ag(I) efflux system membrane fusion protein
MKTIRLFAITLLSIMMFNATAQDKTAGTSEVNPEFQKQLGDVVKSAGELSNVFATDNAAKVDIAAAKVKDAISATDMHLLTGENHMTWMKYMGEMNSQIVKILTDKDIESKRTAFAAFNDALHNSVKAFGIKDEIAYYQFCPMAMNNKGAFWFSNAKEIRNPYLGSKMPACGMTKETIQ